MGWQKVAALASTVGRLTVSPGWWRRWKLRVLESYPMPPQAAMTMRKASGVGAFSGAVATTLFLCAMDIVFIVS